MPGYAGLDVSGYPGAKVMSWLRKNTNLVWCGFYLGPAPSHPGTSWMDKRDQLIDLQWGLAPLYVGQQIIGPGSHHTDAHHGYIDGTDAADLMAKAQFPQKSWVYLDLENGAPFTSEQQAYVTAWVDQVEQQGYAAGIYCSHTFADKAHQVAPTARIWAFKVNTTSPHPVPGPNYPDNHPAGSGYAGAYIWQLGQHCQISVPGAPKGKLIVDLDSAISPDPGAPASAMISSLEELSHFG